jgi:hypothetical protein
LSALQRTGKCDRGQNPYPQKISLRRRRHSAEYYQAEERRLVAALMRARDVIIVGWSASGTDSYYADALRELRAAGVRLRLYVVDYGDDRRALERRLRSLFGSGTDIVDIDMSGFSAATVTRMETMVV